MGLPRRNPRDGTTRNAAELIECPSCGEERLGPHCDTNPWCRWLLCGNRQCRSYGIPGIRWCDMRKLPAA
jgi:hypothetical protein